MATLTVLGIGNILMQDDGIGVRLLEAVRQAKTWPAELEFIDGGTGGLNLLGIIEQARRLVVFDAAELHAPPGSHKVLTARQLAEDTAGRISLHEMPFAETLQLCQQFLTAPDDVVILAIQPGQVDYGQELSPALRREFDTLVQAAVALVEAAWRSTADRTGPTDRDSPCTNTD